MTAADRRLRRFCAVLRPGGRSLLAGCATLAVAAGGLAVGVAGADTEPGQLSTAQMEKGMSPGRPFQDPPALQASQRPGAPVRLVAAPTRFDLAGRRVWGESYNGSFVGPTIYARPGERLTLQLLNRLPVITNLHFHGLHVSPSGSADNPFIQVTPGRSFTYHLVFPANHPQGTFWYHDHGMVVPERGGDGSMPSMPGMAMGPGSAMPGATPTRATGVDVESEVFAGLSGTLLVGDDRALLPANLRHIAVHTIVLKDAQINAQGRIVQNTATTSIDSEAPTVRLVNGQLRPVLTLHPGETQLWRLANEGADIFYRLQLDGYHFTVLGEDGYPVARITHPDTLLMPPGRRFDVLVQAADRHGRAWLRTLAYSNGPQGDRYPETRLLDLHVSGRVAPPLSLPSGEIRTAAAGLAHARVARQRTVILSETPDGKTLFINGRQFDMSRSLFNAPAVLGTVEQWTVLNASGEVHPFHLHTEHFEVMSINGRPQPYTGMVDTVPVPHAEHGVPGRAVIRIRFTDFTGRWMFHCHIAAHEDNGMMSFVNVVRATRTRGAPPGR